MTDTPSHSHSGTDRPLNILHVFRAPAGGVLRHVEDLVRGQIAAGHAVGILCSSDSSCDSANARLAALEPGLKLGLRRMPIPRLPHPKDIAAIAAVRTLRSELCLDIVHGHGAKGGLMARLGVYGARGGKRDQDPDRHARAIYTPHGGSLHYDAKSLAGMLYLGIERMLNGRTDAFIFESMFAREAFAMKVGEPRAYSKVVHNGVGEQDFRPLPLLTKIYDIAFVGELRLLKGVDTLLDALATLRTRKLKVVIAGDGADREYFKDRACMLGLAHMVTFPGTVKARDIFAQSQMVVVPSLAESLPYVVLEALAAGMPLVSTRSGGIPEIFGRRATQLVAPDDALALASEIAHTLDTPDLAIATARDMRQDIARRFSVGQMVDGVEEVYRAVLCDAPAAHAGQVMTSRPHQTARGA